MALGVLEVGARNIVKMALNAMMGNAENHAVQVALGPK